MACRFEVTLSDLDRRHVAAALDALGDANRLEGAWTLFRPSSLLVAINQTAASQAVAIDEELFDLLSRCVALHADTDGAFDITTTPLSRCWGFLRREGRLPTGDEIAAALARVDMRGLELDATARTVRFARPGLELNLGSVGKGFAVGAIAARLRTAGIRHALVSAGSSSIAALGGRGRGWSIDLRSRQARHRRLARVWLRDGAMGTSGAGEQFIEVDGRRYGHVIDPRTGWPATGVLSATVITADGATADALATAFFIGGARARAPLLCGPPGNTRDPHPGRWRGAAAGAGGLPRRAWRCRTQARDPRQKGRLCEPHTRTADGRAPQLSQGRGRRAGPCRPRRRGGARGPRAWRPGAGGLHWRRR